MGYQTVIFDMDGTILETLEDMYHSVNVTMDHMGCPRRTMAEVRRFVGNGADKLIERCMPMGEKDPRFSAALTFYRAYYAAHAQRQTAPYPGVPELLHKLQVRGVQTAVVSNKPDGAVQQLAERYFPGLFAAAVGDRAGWQKKPAPDSVAAVMRSLHASPETTAYVGDSEVDIATAQNAGLPCISVTWGFRDESELKARGARLLAHSAEELLTLLTE